MITNILKKHWLTILGTILGLIGGYLYWIFIGCRSGRCPISSSPINASLVGALLLGLLFNSFEAIKKNN